MKRSGKVCADSTVSPGDALEIHGAASSIAPPTLRDIEALEKLIHASQATGLPQCFTAWIDCEGRCDGTLIAGETYVSQLHIT